VTTPFHSRSAEVCFRDYRRARFSMCRIEERRWHQAHCREEPNCRPPYTWWKIPTCRRPSRCCRRHPRRTLGCRSWPPCKSKTLRPAVCHRRFCRATGSDCHRLGRDTGPSPSLTLVRSYIDKSTQRVWRFPSSVQSGISLYNFHTYPCSRESAGRLFS